ncbi:MAG TPA: hypothetical protein VH143_17580 [Kofleriaceae bacterium]|jgi:hypothetical protein|nr:hypothetical protein [Kofleriaceae bacterium]
MRRGLGAVWVTCVACYVEPSPPIVTNIAFVTSHTILISSITTFDTADDFCNTSAAAAHLPGHYVAWLSSSTTSAVDRLGSARGWVRPDGKPFADRASDVGAGRLFYPLRIDENGQDVVGGATTTAPVATGTNYGGTFSNNCDDFTDSGSNIVVGFADATTAVWTQYTAAPCTSELHLYCLGIDANGPVTPADTGKLAFLSTEAFTPSTGLASADQICSDEATANGVSGTFGALLATNGSASIARFGPTSGSRWVRPDHVAITDGLEELSAPCNVTLDLTYGGNTVTWTGGGGVNMPGNAGTTCNNWSGSSGDGVAGGTSRSGTNALGITGTLMCSQPTTIYCFEM